MSIGILALALLLGLVLDSARGMRRRRRGRRRAGCPPDGDLRRRGSHEPPPARGPPADPYATLAASPDPAGPVEVGDEGARGAEPD